MAASHGAYEYNMHENSVRAIASALEMIRDDEQCLNFVIVNLMSQLKTHIYPLVQLLVGVCD